MSKSNNHMAKSTVNKSKKHSGKEKKKPQLLYEQYYDMYDEYSKQYSKVALLMQVGGFFEIYSPPDYSRANGREISQLMNCDLIQRDPRNDDSPLMSGFPLRSLEKNVAKLAENDYTVIVVEQTKDGDLALQSLASDPTSNNREARVITRIESKGTMFNTTKCLNNTLAIFCTQHGNKHSDGYMSFGFAVTDILSSKKCIIHEVYSTRNDNGLALDTAIRFIMQFDPVECIVVTKHGEEPNVLKHLPLKNVPIVKRDVQTITESVSDYTEVINYAVGSLKTFLKDHKLGTDNLTYEYYKDSRYVDLCSTAIKQLDLHLYMNKSEINTTLTPMGYRLLWNRIVCPLIHADEINALYDKIDALSENDVKYIRDILRSFPDMDKWGKRMLFGKLSFGQMRNMHNCYKSIMEMAEKRNENPAVVDGVKNMIAEYSKVLKLDTLEDVFANNAMSAANGETDEESLDSEGDKKEPVINGNIFREGYCKELDGLFLKKKEAEIEIENFIKMAVKAVPKTEPKSFKIKDGFGIVTTNNRAELLKKKYKNWKFTKLTGTSKDTIIYTDALRDSLVFLKDIAEQISALMSSTFEKYQISLNKKYSALMDEMSKYVSELDFNQCSYNMKKRFRLCRPQFVQDKVLDVKGLRHLVIELINPETRYIPNDLCLEKDKTHGMLLYGVNSCGKTSLLKALAIAAITAQSGLYVAADTYVSKPFTRIMTRISGGDNLERSQSSFIVELEELKSVLTRSDNSSLVLGDEICHSTEVDSANAIVHTMLQELASKTTFFVAATHLHEISSKMNENDHIIVKHMKVSFDTDGEPIYERLLRNGPGIDKYGLEIARAIGFSEQFIQKAISFRKTELSQKKSRYNSKKILVSCEICGYKPTDEYHLPLDTHHIDMQCNADTEGYHASQHKDALHNLVALCKMCHIKVHTKELTVRVQQGLKKNKIIVENIM